MPQAALTEPLRRWDPEQIGGYALVGRLAEEFGYGWTDIEWLTVNAMKSAFAGFDERLHLINTVIKPGFATARATSDAVIPASLLGARPPE